MYCFSYYTFVIRSREEGPGDVKGPDGQVDILVVSRLQDRQVECPCSTQSGKVNANYKSIASPYVKWNTIYDSYIFP